MKKGFAALLGALVLAGDAANLAGQSVTALNDTQYRGKKTGRRKSYHSAKPAGTGKKIYRYARANFK